VCLGLYAIFVFARFLIAVQCAVAGSAGTVHQLFIELKKAYASIKREVPYNILLEFGIPMKLISAGLNGRAV
jgi:hypothetical protein